MPTVNWTVLFGLPITVGIFLTFDRIQLLLGSVSEIPAADGADSRYRTQCSPLLQHETLPPFYNNSDESLLS